MFRKLLVFFLFLALNSFSQTVDSSNVSIVDKKELSVTIGIVSKWQFQNSAPATFETQKTPSAIEKWYPIKLDSVSHISKIIPDFKGTGWFRIYIKNDSSVKQNYLGIRFSQNGASEVFINGKMVSKQGRFSTENKKGFTTNTRKSLYYSAPDSGLTELLIKYENANLAKEVDAKSKGSYLAVRIGDANSSIFNSLPITLYTVFYTMFFTVFFVHFILYLFYPKNFSNLYFAFFNLAFSIFCYNIVSINQTATFGFAKNLFQQLLIGSAFISLSALFNYLFGEFRVRFWLMAGSILVATMLSEIFYSEKSHIAIMISAVLVLSEALYLTFKAKRNKVPDTTTLLIGLITCFCTLLIGALLILFGNGFMVIGLIGLSVLIASFAILLSITAFLASKIARTNESLSRQLDKVEKLSNEKEHILKTQNEFLEQQVSERTSELQLEKQKSDDLLLNILPHEVAEELKNTGKTEAQHYDEVSVLFTDFVSFTSISQKLGVGELIHELNENFTAFDHIMEKHGLEKIKTIGDAYLAVSGLPIKNYLHANAAILAALDILDYVEERKKTSPYALNIRIGIHSGPLVAGIIGVKKFAFDIWGDTVNTAARMEQNSESGKINISANTYELVQDTFVCESREVISVKGKGDMEMYFVKGRKG